MSAARSISAWDDYPIHQTSEYVRHPATSDRNFYDRYYFCMHGSNDEQFTIFGLGQYPNLGTQDAFITCRKGDTHHIVRASKEIDDRSNLQTGPIRIEIIEPLKTLRVIVEPTEHSVAMDVTWQASQAPFEEPRQYIRSKGKVVFDTQRFAQLGSWEGTLEVGGETIIVDPETFGGSRDRSWGVRPVGEKEPDGIRQGTRLMQGMWNYQPVDFGDFAIVYMLHEQNDGQRLLEEAVKVAPDGSTTWLGRPEHDHTVVEGARMLAGSTISFPDAPGGPASLVGTPMLVNYVSLGTGYGIEPDWRHGQYQGELTVQGFQRSTEEMAEIGQYGVVDHAGRYVFTDHTGEYEGYGLYEHGFFGAYDRYGFEAY